MERGDHLASATGAHGPAPAREAVGLSPSLCSESGKARLATPVDHHGFNEHRRWSHPQPAFIIECLVNHERFEGLRMPREPEHTILVTLVMAVAAGFWFGGKWGEGFCHEENEREVMWNSGNQEAEVSGCFSCFPGFHIQ